MNKHFHNFRTLSFAFLFTICLSSCNSSIPSNGFKKIKTYYSDYMKSIGGTGSEITYDKIPYVHITGDGTMQAGNLVDSVYYKIFFTMTIDNKSQSGTTFAVYYSQTDNLLTGSSYSTAYSYALSLVNDGSLKGTTGTL